MTYHLVWFKRDLRCVDDAALSAAAALGPVRCVYVVEPQLWSQPDVALQHFEFIRESLLEVDAELRLQGGALEIHYGELREVLSKLWQEAPFASMHSHQETGNQFTYKRDQQVAEWCEDHQLPWTEYPQFGVVRGLKNRDAWQSAWEKHMALPIKPLPKLQFWSADPIRAWTMPTPAHLQHNPPQRQRGGRTQAESTLTGFLNARSIGYRGGISSPLSAPDACSRLSVYLTWGCISMREVVQSTRTHLKSIPPQASRHRAGLTAFISRLYWHCHFIQKLESEPEIEWRNMHRGYDHLRESEFSQAHFEALKNARTGWPMVDACVTMLRETGWLNFRMRAMLVSTAAYPLWLHWRPVGEWLATQFLDYEPGIHWSQLQMQSGTTGINLTRVYNPIKQAQDHDTHGRFVRKWLPYMRQVPDTWLFEPWRMTPDVASNAGLMLGADIIEPIVDLSQATRSAKERLHGRRNQASVRAAKKAVIEKHASRAPMPQQKRSNTKSVKSTKSTAQLGFDF